MIVAFHGNKWVNKGDRIEVSFFPKTKKNVNAKSTGFSPVVMRADLMAAGDQLGWPAFT
jgi:hypothetical protein